MGSRNRLVPVSKFAEENWLGSNRRQKWIQLYPFDEWDHPIYGKTTIDLAVATQLKENFDAKVKDAHVFTDYEHGMDKAKGNKASGELVKVDVRDDGLWGCVEFTADAKKEIEAGEWNYWSTSHYDTWTHPQSKESFSYVLDGGGLTNKPWVKGMIPLNFSEVLVLEVENEVAPEEFQEPGTGIIDPNVNPDDSYPNRADTPEAGEDGSIPSRPVTGAPEGSVMDDAAIAALREALGLDEDADLVAHITAMHEELEPLRELKKQQSEKKAFAETYPAEFARLQKLEEESRENYAKRFSESLAARRFSRATDKKDDEGNAVMESTSVGLSAKAIDEITSLVKEFGENTATLEGFSNVLDSILDSGIVDYGNHGSTREAVEVAEPKDGLEGRKMFAEKVNEIMEEDKLDFEDALVEAAKKYPALYESWQSPVHG